MRRALSILLLALFPLALRAEYKNIIPATPSEADRSRLAAEKRMALVWGNGNRRRRGDSAEVSPTPLETWR